MKIIVQLFTSSLGRKFIMAITGCVLFLFVIGHMVGNLQIFLGPEVLNRYGYLLQSNIELLWPVRIALLVIVALHIWSAIQLSIDNRRARGVPYDGAPTPYAASYASRTMLMSGLIIVAFIIYHLLHYTVQVDSLNFTGQSFRGHEFTYLLHGQTEAHDVYKMMVVGFQNPLVSLFYIVAMALLCLHLSHGVSAMFQSLGLRNKVYAPLIDKGAKAIAIIIFVGYVSIPTAVLLGLGRDYASHETIPAESLQIIGEVSR